MSETNAVSVFCAMLQRCCVYAIAFLSPLFLIPQPWATIPQSKTLVLAVLVVLGFICWFVRIAFDRKITFSIDSLVLASILIPIAYASSALFSGSGVSSLVSGEALQSTVTSVMMLFGVVALTVLSVSEVRHVRTLVTTSIFAGGIAVIFQVARLFMPESLSLFGALSGNTASIVGSWHDLGIMLGFLIVLSVGYMQSIPGRNMFVSAALLCVAVLSAGLMLVVNFADVWYAVAIVAFCMAIVRMARAYRASLGMSSIFGASVLWLVIAVITACAGFWSPAIYEKMPVSLQISQVEVRPSLEGTLLVGQKVFEAGNAFVFGSGPNTFNKQWALLKPVDVNSTNFWNTEFVSGVGIVPTAFVTVGIVGSIAWILLMLALLWSAYLAWRDQTDLMPLRIVLVAACAYLMSYHVMYVPGIGVSATMFLLLGALASLNSMRTWVQARISLDARSITLVVVMVAVSLVIILSALATIRSVVATMYAYRAAVVYAATNDIAAASELVNTAIKINPRNDIAQRAAVEVGLLQFRALALSGATDDASVQQMQTTLSETISHGLAAVSIDDASYQNWLALAGLYQSLAGAGIQGAYEQASSAYLRAASTTPANPLPFVQLGQLAMVQGNSSAAIDYFGQAISRKPDLAAPYYLRSQVEASQANYDAAITDAAAAVQLVNQDPLGWYNLGLILYVSNDIQNAAVAFERAISLENNYSNALFALAVSYDRLNLKSEALAVAQRLLQLNPNDATISQLYANLSVGKSALEGVASQ